MKKLSFVLAMIIALSGVIGLFSAPAYAADDVAFDYEYVVGEGGYATIADAAADVKKNEEAKSGTHGIKVTGNVTESAKTTFVADVTIYGVGATKPVITVTISGGAEWIHTTGALTVKDVDINVTTAHDVAFIPDKADSDVTFDNCDITTLGRGIHQKNGSKYENSSCAFKVVDCTINAAKVAIQANNRDPKDADPKNVYVSLYVNNCKIESASGGNGAILVNDACADVEIIDSEVTAKKSATAGIYFNRGDKPGNVNATFTNTKFVGNGADGFKTTNKNATFTFIDCEIIGGETTGYGINARCNNAEQTGVINILGNTVVSAYKNALFGNYDYNIYGGNFSNNCPEDEDETKDSAEGQGVLYVFNDYSVANIYGGTFTVNNEGTCIAGHGSQTHNINIYGGTFIDNGTDVYLAKDKTDETKMIPTGLGSILCSRGGEDASAKNWNIYGGKFYTKCESDFELYRYANAEEMYVGLVEKGLFTSVDHAKANFGLDKYSYMLGALNSAADSIKVTDIDKTYNGEEYAIAVEITPDLDGVDYNSDLFKVKGVQILKGTTPNSPSTVARVLFMVKADQIANYDNLAAWFSTDNATCLKLDGEIPAGLLAEYGHSGAFVNETAKTNKVYSSVLAGDVKVAADAGYYFVPVTVNVSNDNFDTDIYLRLFAREDGGEGIAISDVVTLNIAKLFN